MADIFQHVVLYVVESQAENWRKQEYKSDDCDCSQSVFADENLLVSSAQSHSLD